MEAGNRNRLIVIVIVFSPFHRFSVVVWTREDDSDTIRVDGNGEKISVSKNLGILVDEA